MNKFMQTAKQMAKINEATGFEQGGPFGAVIVKDNKVIAVGKNNVLIAKDPTAHAEISAIRNACQTLNTHDLKGCDIYTSCMPCPMCLGAIIWANIENVYYGNTKEDAADIGFRDDMMYGVISDIHENNVSNSKQDILKFIQMDREETIETFNAFKNLNEKKLY